MPKTSTASLLNQDIKHLIHPLHNRAQHSAGKVWSGGEGIYLIDSDGNRYFDGLSGLWCNTAGFSRPELIEAATKQLEKMAYASGYSGSTNPAAIELAGKLSAITYPNINRFFFTCGGGEASDSNFKMARYYWKKMGKPGKYKVISRQWGYHGVTLAAMSATGINPYWSMFEPRVPGFVHIPSPYPYRYQAPKGQSQGIAAANELEKAILTQGADSVAMFIAEPVHGAGGVIPPQDDYFPRIREICDEYDVLLVSDEVITGFGRTGKMFGLEHWNVQPDMMQFAKAITSGYFPLGGIGVSDKIAEVLDNSDDIWMHAYTYSAHPVGCAVGSAMIDIICEEDFPAQASVKGEHLLNGLRQALNDHPNVGDIRGKGLMCAFEIVKDKQTKQEFSPDKKIGPRIMVEATSRGLFSRVRGDVYCIAPPIITTPAQIDEMVNILAESVKAVLG